MDRAEILTAMSELKLYGMKAAFDEIITTAVKRQHEPQRIIGDLLSAEIAEKQARSIRYQITIAKLPLAKDLTDFRFDNTPVNEALVRDLARSASSWRTSAMSSWSAELAQGRRILLLRSRALASAMVPAAGSSMSSIWSTSWRRKAAPGGRAVWPSIFAGKTSLCSMSSGTCRLPNPAGNCCST